METGGGSISDCVRGFTSVMVKVLFIGVGFFLLNWGGHAHIRSVILAVMYSMIRKKIRSQISIENLL